MYIENTDIPLKVIILSVILELPLSVRGVVRRTQLISKLLTDLRITSALNWLAYYKVLYIRLAYYKSVMFLLICIGGPDLLYLGKLARKWCELEKDGKSNTFINLEVQ